MVLTADNSLPHLGRDNVVAAVRGFRSHLDRRYYIFQTRDCDGDSYDVAMYFVREETADSPAHVVSGRNRYHALSIDDLSTLLAEIGFVEIERIDGSSHQPLVVASRLQTATGSGSS